MNRIRPDLRVEVASILISLMNVVVKYPGDAAAYIRVMSTIWAWDYLS